MFNFSPQIELLLIGFLCVFIHCLIKADSLRRDKKANQKPFHIWTDYVSDDYLVILISFAAVFLWRLVYQEVALSYEKITPWTKCSFGAVGFLGSYLIQYWLSQSKKKIREQIKDDSTFANKVQAERDAEKNQE